ncbi:MAG: translation elongation factor Ts [Planctomycetota bacterium]|nr:MAG: translation elongation factor Ts [Planctomycetota bacterium]
MEITAAMVKALRDKTGLSMMDCKKALVEAGGDEAKAIELLREKGLAKVAKMADREAGEGRIGCYVDADNQRAAIVELRCETAPVANTDDFKTLTDLIARHAAAHESPTPENIRDMKLLDDASRTVGDAINDVFNRLRENIQIARIAKVVGPTAHYVHFDGQKGALARFNAPCPDELGAGVCMHIVAMNPPCLRREDADPAEVEAERQRYAADAEGKPPEIAERIIEGKLGRWYSEFVLLEQPYVKDDKKSVGQALREANPDLTIEQFIRYQVGGV